MVQLTQGSNGRSGVDAVTDLCLLMLRVWPGATHRECWSIGPRGREAYGDASGLPALSALVGQPRAAASCQKAERLSMLDCFGFSSGAAALDISWFSERL